ncbi:MAG: phosphatase [Opitutales bacterium]|nr:phosphatase [Opitutales bacterium]
MTSPRVFVIDIGSNSIKCLVASLDGQGKLQAHFQKTMETRISTGIGSARPQLSEDAMQAGVRAVEALFAAAASFGPFAESMITATSAVRDASNGAEFCDRVQTACGLRPRILSGEEEARYISRGIVNDPMLSALGGSFTLLDIGGGSLELIEMDGGVAARVKSLPLGAVRMAESLPGGSAIPITEDIRSDAERRVRGIVEAGWGRPVAPFVGAGGAFAVILRLVLEKPPESSPGEAAFLTTSELTVLYEELTGLGLEDRLRRYPRLPPTRADIMPAALAVILTVLRMGGGDRVFVSFFNLRFGLASELLRK